MFPGGLRSVTGGLSEGCSLGMSSCSICCILSHTFSAYGTRKNGRRADIWGWTISHVSADSQHGNYVHQYPNRVIFYIINKCLGAYN